MSNLSTFAEVGIVDARASSGTLIVPRSTDIPGRVITYKDIYGAVGNSTIALLCSTNDTFEDGSKYKTLQNPYDFITLYAASTNMWAIIGGTQLINGFRVPIMSNSSNFTSSITANTVNTAYTYTSFLFPQTGLSNIIISNVLPTVNATTTGIGLGNITSNFYQFFSQSTITSNIGASFSATSTINVNASLIPAYSTSIVSTISLGTNTNRWNQVFAVSTFTSSIISGTMSLDRLFGGSILSNATTSQNLYPFSAGAAIGFGSNIAQGGTYSEGHFRSTFTTVIQPKLDAGSNFSNIIYINGFTSTQSIFTSSIITNNMSSIQGNVSSINVNTLTFGAGNGYVNIPFVQSVLVSSIQFNTSIMNASTINTNTISAATMFYSTLNLGNLSTGIFNTSTINAKVPAFWSTLIIPPSSFSITGANAGTPIVLYSNVQFPPYTKGYFNLHQKCILSKTSGTNTQYINANILYTQGIFPSSTTIYDAYSALPYVADVGASTFTTCVSMVSISSITTRNICFYDTRANTYTANLFMGNLIVQYVPSFGFSPDIGQNITGVN